MSDEELRAILFKKLDENEYIRSLNIEFEELTLNHTVARMPFLKSFANPYGTMHGGILYSLADIVCGTAAWMTGNPVTTVSGNFQYMSPMANSEYVHIEVAADKIGKTLITYSVKISDDAGNIVNTATFTFYRMKGSI